MALGWVAALSWTGALGWVSPSWAAAPTATDKQKIGLTALEARVPDAPDGTGVSVTQVESLYSGSTGYMVNTSLADFAGDTISDASGFGTESYHANNIGLNLYGANGVAPGVSSVQVYEANNWMGTGLLRTLTAAAPKVSTAKVQNNSWIGSFSDTSTMATATDVMRRTDYVINRDGVIVVSGVNNGSSTSVPQVMANAYNGISVGLTSGYSSSGPSTVDVPGRSKPDLVAPSDKTSVATAWVSGAAAILVQAGAGNADAQRPETVKAVLMAGAVKTPFDLTNSTASATDNWSHTPTQPLDLRFGAGQLNIDNSHQILTAGEQSPGDVSTAGWNYTGLTPGNQHQYVIDVPHGYVAYEVSALATWNRQIAFVAGTGGNAATLTPSLANLDLTLTGNSGGNLLEQSISTIDNVEHVYRQFLPSGQYALTVANVDASLSANYALAWNVKLVLAGDANGDGKVDGVDYSVWGDHYGQSNVGYAKGDFNMDGIVNGVDYAIWGDHFGMTALTVQNLAVPEPAGWVTLLLGLVGLGWARRRLVAA